MKLQGRTKRELTENDIALCESFLKGTESYVEFAKKNGMTKAQLRYLISRYRTERAQRRQEQETVAGPAVYKILLRRTLNFPSEEIHFEFFRKAISKFPKALLVFMTDNDNIHSEMKKAGNPVTLVKDYPAFLAESHTESKISAYLIISENVSAYLDLKGLFLNALSGIEKEKFWNHISSVWKNDYLEVSDVDTTIQHKQIINRPVSITMDKCISIVSLESETKTRQASAYCRIYAEADNKKEATSILMHPYYELGEELTFKKKLRDSLDRYLNLGWSGNPKNAFAVTELRWQESNDSIRDRLIPSEEFCKKLSRFSPYVMSRWFAVEDNPANCCYGKDVDWHSPVVMARTYRECLFTVGSRSRRFIQNEMLQMLARDNTEIVMAGNTYSDEPVIVRNVFGQKIKVYEIYTVINHPCKCDVLNPFDFRYCSSENLDGYKYFEETPCIPEVAVPLIETLIGEKVSPAIASKIRAAECEAYAPYIQAAKDSAKTVTYPVLYNDENGEEKRDIHTASRIDFFDSALAPTLADVYHILCRNNLETSSKKFTFERLLDELSTYCSSNPDNLSFDKQKVSDAIQLLKDELIPAENNSLIQKDKELQKILDEIAPLCGEGMYFNRKTTISYREKFIYVGFEYTQNEKHMEAQKFIFTRFFTNKAALNHLGNKYIYFYADPDEIQFSRIQELIKTHQRTSCIFTGYWTRKLDSEEKINAFKQSEIKVLLGTGHYGNPYSYSNVFSEEKSQQYKEYFERFEEGCSSGVIITNYDEIPFDFFITKEWMLNMAT